MAALRKKPRSPFWFACFSLPDGRRTQRSTKVTDRRQALRLAIEWEDAAMRRLTEAQAHRVLSDILEQIHGSPLASPSVADFSAQWMNRKRGETSPTTHAAYRGAVEDFCRFLGEKAAQPLHYVVPAQIAAWRDVEATRSSPSTANHKIKIVRTMFQSAWRDGLLTDNAAAKVGILKATEASRRPFTLGELRTILAVANTEWRGLILAGLYTGQRLKDIASLTWANVDIERNEIRLSTSKTGRRQVLPIAKPLRAYLEESPVGDNPQAPLFPAAFPLARRAGGTSMLSQQFHGLLVSAGLAAARLPKRRSKGVGRAASRELSQISFHSLRHTATSLLKAAGVSEAVARNIIGHESAEISRHYTHVDDEAKRAAVDKLPDLSAISTVQSRLPNGAANSGAPGGVNA